jgi:hypothetical protein
VSATVREQDLHGMRWLTVTGERREAFRALGDVAAREIRASLDGLPEVAALQRYAAKATGRAAVASIVDATGRTHPDELQDVLDLAIGAGYPSQTVLLANLRGDLVAEDGRGCSDLGWRGERSYIAHNEDGSATLAGRLTLLTLAVEDAVPVMALWYPGFLPSNAFCVTGAGLAWGINHIPVPSPAVAAGRHFVARGLQHLTSLDDAVAYLRSNPCAGGFTYTIGDLASGRVVTVETAAGRSAVVEADPHERPLLYHTNHLRFLEEQPAHDPADGGHLGQTLRRQESEARCEVLAALAPPAGGPDTAWFLDVLTGRELPHGVLRSATGTDPFLTLATAVVDLTGRTLTVQARDAAPVTLPVEDLLRTSG